MNARARILELEGLLVRAAALDLIVRMSGHGNQAWGEAFAREVDAALNARAVSAPESDCGNTAETATKTESTESGKRDLNPRRRRL